MSPPRATAVERQDEALDLRPMKKDEVDLERFRACFAKNSPRPRSRASLEWQYWNNPTGKLFVDLALAPGAQELAAIYASLPGWMRVGGQRRLALQSLDTLTDEAFRGKGLFVKLANRTFARAETDGAALIYGFPNGNSAHGFFKKLGWTSLDPVPFLLRPLRLSYAADRLKLPAVVRALVPNAPLVAPFGPRRDERVREIQGTDPRLDQLWQRFSTDVGVAIERDAQYLDWRLFQRPDSGYRVLVTESADNHDLQALCAFAVHDKHGGRIGYVMELMHDRSLRGMRAASRLLGIAVREMSDAGADSVLAWSLAHSPSFPIYARHAFFPLPERLRPIELHFGARAFDSTVSSIVGDRRRWYLSYLDSDTV